MAESRSIPGFFLGYRPQPGGCWQIDYFVAPLQAFGVNLDVAIKDVTAKVPVRIVREFVAPVRGEEVFPLRVAYERIRHELQGTLTGRFRLNLPSRTDYVRFGFNKHGPIDTSTDELEHDLRRAADIQLVRGVALYHLMRMVSSLRPCRQLTLHHSQIVAVVVLALVLVRGKFASPNWKLAPSPVPTLYHCFLLLTKLPVVPFQTPS